MPDPFQICDDWRAALADEPNATAVRDFLTYMSDPEAGKWTDMGGWRPWQMTADDSPHFWAERFVPDNQPEHLYQQACAVADAVALCVIAAANGRTKK